MTQANPQKFQVGDTVQLNSGGPEMTVQSVFEIPQEEGPAKVYARCSWMDEAGRAHHDHFDVRTIQRANKAVARMVPRSY